MRQLANIEGDEIVIRVPISTIPHAVCAALEQCGVEVTDERQAAASIVRYLNDEDEEGSTPIHFALDRALRDAVGQGEEGFSFSDDDMAEDKLLAKVAAILKQQRANRYAEEAIASSDLIDQEDARKIISTILSGAGNVR